MIRPAFLFSYTWLREVVLKPPAASGHASGTTERLWICNMVQAVLHTNR
jgi:hypothetical protein